MRPTLCPSEIDAITSADKLSAKALLSGSWVAIDSRGNRIFATGGEESFRALWQQAMDLRTPPPPPPKKANASASKTPPKTPVAPPQTPPRATAGRVTPAPAPKPVKTAVKNPYDAGTQKWQAYELLRDGRPHTWEEFRAINAKYPRDPSWFLAKDGKTNGLWEVLRDSEGAQLRFLK